MEMYDRRFRLPVLFVILVLLLSSCIPFGQKPPGQTQAPANDTQIATSAAAPSATADALPSATATGAMDMSVPNTGQEVLVRASDQAVTDNQLTIDQVVSAQPGWVVVYTTNAAGQPDQPIGQAPVPAGTSQNVKVGVDPALAKGLMVVQLHADLGQVGTFEFPGVDAPVMVGVQMISSSFKVTENQAQLPAATEMSGMAMATQPPGTASQGGTPAITTANQPIANSAIILPEVVSVGEAWVVIHRQNGDGSLGTMVGYVKVHDGINKNVSVPLDTTRTSSTMVAMLHENRANKSSPQFPGEDVPVAVDGVMVMAPFDVTTAQQADVVVMLGSTPATVSYLVDGSGMSLYVSLGDTPGKSNCTGDCLKQWTPLLATGRLVSGTGVLAANLGVTLRPDGARQVTYLGNPLYRFAGDTQPGDLNGQGFEGSWFLVTP
jgi:predicted lipoprotein with Yx(FWY)xxD motif